MLVEGNSNPTVPAPIIATSQNYNLLNGDIKI